MHDAAYKKLFSSPRMVRDLLDGFVARGWSDDLDFDALESLPTGFVSRNLQQQRYGDLLWRIPFRDGRRLYLVLLLEFQTTVDRAMAVRMLTYTGLLYERLAADGALRGRGAPPPVLPVVIYNGRRRWTAPVEMRELMAGKSELLAPYQPSPRYYLLDAARAADADLPPGNLVSALVGLEKTRHEARVAGPLKGLMDLLRSVDDDDLKRVFAALLAGLWDSDWFPAAGQDPLAQLQETQTMLEENIQAWTGKWIEKGRAQGLEQGRAQGLEKGLEQERALLCRLTARKFDAGAAEGLAAALAGVTDADRLARVGDWIIECESASDLLARVRGDGGGRTDRRRSSR